MSTDTMALTLENVEKVLDELRPFLMADGGNVDVVELMADRSAAVGPAAAQHHDAENGHRTQDARIDSRGE